ncbi:hypothetical protein FRC02_002548 [Tulasnella sp. 418]|nr:hypothetical protein FRC02_002548 [Tulasnella sp. 418]
MKETTLCQIFAVIPTTVSRYLDFSLTILKQTLQKLPEGRIQYPQYEDVELFETLTMRVQERHPMLTNIFGSLDGLKVPIGASSDPEIENQNYNGWLHNHFVSNVFLFSSEGIIIAASLNCPGSWHDSRVATPIYEKLRSCTPLDFSVAADTAFPRGPQSIQNRIRAPLKAGQRLPDDPVEREAALKYSRQLTSYRQTAEWGMRTIQGSFSRLKLPLDANDAAKRAKILEVVTRLHNVRTARVGRNQITTTYHTTWREDQQHRELWDGFEGMLFGEIQRRDRVARFHVIAVEDT